MRLGGPILTPFKSPEEWVAAVRSLGYAAAYCPVGPDSDDGVVRSYRDAARSANIVIAETGAWSNPLSPDESKRREAMDKCKKMLLLAERIGARCAVNIAGSRGEKWDGPCCADLTDETFDMIVHSVREIIDAVKPRQAFYTLEPMPWMYPDSAESYLRLLKATDRQQFGVHFDPVNMINSPERYFRNGAFVRDFVEKLAPHIRSCHAKDILLGNSLTVHLDEVRPGTGNLDYKTFLSVVDSVSPDMPVMLEHLPPKEEEYKAAADYVRKVASENAIGLR